MEEEILDVVDFIEKGEIDDTIDFYQENGGIQNVPQPQSSYGIPGRANRSILKKKQYNRIEGERMESF